MRQPACTIRDSGSDGRALARGFCSGRIRLDFRRGARCEIGERVGAGDRYGLRTSSVTTGRGTRVASATTVSTTALTASATNPTFRSFTICGAPGSSVATDALVTVRTTTVSSPATIPAIALAALT